jgi:hypothetical protein
MYMILESTRPRYSWEDEVREDGRVVGGEKYRKTYIIGRNRRYTWELQEIVAFCTWKSIGIGLKTVPAWGKIKRGVYKYSYTTVSITSRLLQYMDTIYFQTLFQNRHNLCERVSLWRCTMDFFYNSTDKEIPQSVNGDDSLEHVWDWSSYCICIYHSDINTPQYVHVDVPSNVNVVWMFYCTHHSDKDTP